MIMIVRKLFLIIFLIGCFLFLKGENDLALRVFKFDIAENILGDIDGGLPFVSDVSVQGLSWNPVWDPSFAYLILTVFPGTPHTQFDHIKLYRYDALFAEAALLATGVTEVNTSKTEPVEVQDFDLKSLVDEVVDLQVLPGAIEDTTGVSDDRVAIVLNQSKDLVDSLDQSLGKGGTKVQKLFEKNLLLSKKLADFYKKSFMLKSTRKERVIDEPGVYRLHKDFYGTIMICSNNVTLDLNKNAVISHLKIPVTIDSQVKNISIKNGKIIGGDQFLGASSGILIKEGVQKVTLENLVIKFCYEGVTFAGVREGSVIDCLVQNCYFTSNIKGACLDCSESIIFKECDFFDCFLENVDL